MVADVDGILVDVENGVVGVGLDRVEGLLLGGSFGVGQSAWMTIMMHAGFGLSRGFEG